MRALLAATTILMTTQAHAFTLNPVQATTDERTCLALNLYHEARGEKMRGMIAVMKVTLARLQDPEFPDTICDVVWEANKHVAQFSWTRDGLPDTTINDVKAWVQAKLLVNYYFAGKLHLDIDPTVTFYHSGPVTKFFKRLHLVKQVGHFLFYRANR